MPIYEICDVIVDTDRASVSKNGINLNLPGNTYELFVCLLKSAPKLLSNQEIMDSVWSNRVVNPDSIKVNITRIRKILDDNSKEPKYIESVRGKGYRCANQVTIRTMDAHPSQPNLSKKLSKIYILAFSAMAAIVMAAYFFFPIIFYEKSEKNFPVRVAVLPFVSLNSSESDGYLADGITEELIHSLVQSKNLKILSRTTIMGYKNSNLSISEIAKQLDLEALVEGSIRRSGDRIRVYVQLVNGETEEHYWSMEFNQSYDEIFSIQSQVVNRIVKTLQANVADNHEVKIPTTNMLAYDDYLKGVYYYNKRTADDFDAAIVLFKKAIDRDPSFLNAKAWLANSYAQKSRHQINDEFAKLSLDLASEIIDKTTDPRITKQAYKALGIIYKNLGKGIEQRNVSEKTLQIEPDFYPGVFNLASVYFDIGELALAAEYFKKYFMHEQEGEKDQLLSASYSRYAVVMNMLGFMDSAVKSINTAIEIETSEPEALFINNVILRKLGRQQKAINLTKDYLKIKNNCIPCMLSEADFQYFKGTYNEALQLLALTSKMSLKSDTRSAIRIARIQFMKNKQILTTELLDNLEKIKRIELEFINNGHNDKYHFVALGYVESFLNNYEISYEWFNKAIDSGVFLNAAFTLEPLIDPALEKFRQSDYFNHLITKNNNQITIQKKAVLVNKITLLD